MEVVETLFHQKLNPKSLDIPQWKPQQSNFVSSTNGCITKYLNHPTTCEINEVVTKDTFSFRHVPRHVPCIPQQTYKAILGMKSTTVEIPTKVLQILANEIYASLTDCINCSILTEIFQMI